MNEQRIPPPQTQVVSQERSDNALGKIGIGCMLVMALGCVLFFIFIAAGLYFLSDHEAEFAAKAKEATATITDMQREQEAFETGDDSRLTNAAQEENRKTVYHLRFTDQTGQSVETTLAEYEDTPHMKQGEEVSILYDPQHPKLVRFLKDKDQAETLAWTASVFVGFVVAIVLALRAFFRANRRSRQ